MKTIIAGSRTITDYATLEEAIASSGFIVTEVISGGAAGVDSMGEWYATKNNLPLTIKKAQWKQYGRSAGPIRNEEMSNVAEALIALWDGKSRGTADIINRAKMKKLRIYVCLVD